MADARVGGVPLRMGVVSTYVSPKEKKHVHFFLTSTRSRLV